MFCHLLRDKTIFTIQTRNIRWNYYVFAMQNTLATTNKDTTSPPRSSVPPSSLRIGFLVTRLRESDLHFSISHRSIFCASNKSTGKREICARLRWSLPTIFGQKRTLKLSMERVSQACLKAASAFMHIRKIKQLIEKVYAASGFWVEGKTAKHGKTKGRVQRITVLFVPQWCCFRIYVSRNILPVYNKFRCYI